MISVFILMQSAIMNYDYIHIYRYIGVCVCVFWRKRLMKAKVCHMHYSPHGLPAQSSKPYQIHMTLLSDKPSVNCCHHRLLPPAVLLPAYWYIICPVASESSRDVSSPSGLPDETVNHVLLNWRLEKWYLIRNA